MPYYPYRCHTDKGGCGEKFEVIKTFSQLNRVETCPECGKEELDKSFRILGAPQIMGADDWNKEEYNPAFGCIVKNKKHRDELAKRHGMIEVGNESPDAMHKTFENQRADRAKKRWDSV